MAMKINRSFPSTVKNARKNCPRGDLAAHQATGMTSTEYTLHGDKKKAALSMSSMRSINLYANYKHNLACVARTKTAPRDHCHRRYSGHHPCGAHNLSSVHFTHLAAVRQLSRVSLALLKRFSSRAKF